MCTLLVIETLQTTRLRLEPLTPAHAEEMFAVLDDVRLHRYTGGAPLDRAALTARFQRLARGRSPEGHEHWMNWIVRLRGEGDRAVGTVQATVDPRSLRGDIAWVVGVPWQGRGIATEAARAVLSWLTSHHIDDVAANILPGHVASERVAERLGLVHTDAWCDGERVWRTKRKEAGA